ncbi:MAG: sugar phosphate isomerase/epimerase [Fimbriimonadia bacterium]
MKLLVFRALWGMEGAPQDMVRCIAEAGYDGVEGIPQGVGRADWTAMLGDHGLKMIAQIFTDTAEDFAAELARAVEYGPLRVNVHSGRDCMSRDEGCAYFERALREEERHGIPVAHETHRGRLFFTPWDTAYYLQRFPTLRVCADFSHWVTVCERMPNDQAEALRLACERAVHIHGRVGMEEGPQVPHPAAPEYERYVLWHEKQWDAIRAAHEARGDEVLTFTPEFGPPGYMHTLPFTDVPVADLWEVCLWSAHRLRERWSDIG